MGMPLKFNSTDELHYAEDVSGGEPSQGRDMGRGRGIAKR